MKTHSLNDSLVRLITAALVLGAIAVTLRAEMLGWGSHEAWSLFSLAMRALLRSYHDLLIILSATVTFGGALVVARNRPRVRQALVATFTAMGVIFCICASINIVAVRVLGVPRYVSVAILCRFMRSFTPRTTYWDLVSHNSLRFSSGAVCFPHRRAACCAARALLCQKVGMAARLHAGSPSCSTRLFFVGTGVRNHYSMVQEGEVLNPVAVVIKTAMVRDTVRLFTFPTSVEATSISRFPVPLAA